MKLFPHILGRVGGSTFEEVKELSFSKVDIVNALLQKEKEVQSQYEKVLETFQFTIQKITDYRLKSVLINAKKDFQSHRASFLKKLKKKSQNDVLNKLFFEISIYSDFKFELKNLQDEFDLIFQKKEIDQYIVLRAFFQKQNIQKGLLQASHSLLSQIKKLDSKSPQNFKKKERQTLRSLAQYFYRIGTKTSPFSHFTTLDILSERDGAFQNESLENEKSFFQFNNFILAEIKELLLKEPSFFRQLELQVNPTVMVKNEEFHFIKNDKNIETIQQIETEEILFVLCRIIIAQDGIEFRSMVEELLKIVEADWSSLENYLLELVQVGFLEWQWGFSGLSFAWEEKLLERINSMRDFPSKNRLKICLDKMIQTKQRVKRSDVQTRFFLQKSIKGDLEKFGMKKIIPELILFEDVQKPISIQLSINQIQPIIQSLDSLLRLLEPLVKNEMKNKISSCWQQNFREEKSVPLIYFYKKFYQTPTPNNNFTKSENEYFFEKIKLGIKENVVVDEEGNLHFYTKDLKDIFPKKNEQVSTQYSGLFQFYSSEGKIKAIINGLTPGFGKLFGRFLPLFNDDITKQLQAWNTELKNDNVWVENVDASIFNANLHPPLLSFEIKNSGSQNALPDEKQISIKDIEVIWDEYLKEPVLVSLKNKKRISIFDFGFEHPENRSPMFQLLNGFSVPHATYRFFLQLVNEVFIDDEPNEIKGFRRVVIDEHLVLQRQSTEVPNSFFPKKEKSETNSSYFLNVQKCKKENNLSQFIFIKPIQNSADLSSDFSKDFFKPQLIDLNSPIAIVLLQKVLEKHSGRVSIIEMLPSGDQLIGDSVAEFAVQWKKFSVGS